MKSCIVASLPKDLGTAKEALHRITVRFITRVNHCIHSVLLNKNKIYIATLYKYRRRDNDFKEKCLYVFKGTLVPKLIEDILT